MVYFMHNPSINGGTSIYIYIYTHILSDERSIGESPGLVGQSPKNVSKLAMLNGYVKKNRG